MAIITNGFLTTSVNGLNINVSYPCNNDNYTSLSSRDIKYIVIHYTGNKADNAINNCKYFQSKGRKSSAHFFCDDNNIYQSVALRDSAWHCGCSEGYKTECRNNNSIGIEMCTSGNYLVSDKTQTNVAYLCAKLCEILGISISSVDDYVLRHYDVVKTNKKCPAQYVDDIKQWAEFKNRVKNILNTGSHKNTSASCSNNIQVTKSYSYNGINYNLVFDPIYYSNKYNDLKKAFGTNVQQLLQHFVNYGMKEGRQACEWFNVTIYKNKYQDLQKVFKNNLQLYYTHYITYGYREGRKASSVDINIIIAANDMYTQSDFIKEVQSAIGAKVDGKIGNETLSKLVTVSRYKNNKHPVVKPLQRYLNTLGYSCGNADGIAGIKFTNAAKSWAKANGCVVDGEFSKNGKSWRKILGVS